MCNTKSLFTLLIFFLLVLEVKAQKLKPFNEPVFETIKNGNFQNNFNNWTVVGTNNFSISSEVPKGVLGKSIKYFKRDSLKNTTSGFYQIINFKEDTYYKLKFNYKGDANLNPIVIIEENFKKKLNRRLIRLNKSSKWEDFNLEFMMGNKGGSTYKVFVFPTGFPFRKKDKGVDKTIEDINRDENGTIYFTNFNLVETKRKNSPIPAGPYTFKTDTIVYKKTASVDLKLYVDIPKGIKGPFPVDILIHGGGWVNGSPTKLLPESKILAERGVACVRVQYRLVKNGGTFKKTMSDIMDAIDWVRNNKNNYQFDMDRLALSGGSAGGHLSAIAAQHTPECTTYIGYWGLYNAYERGLGRFGKGKFIGTSGEEKKNASAIYQIKTPPPTSLLFHGKADPTIDYMQTIHFAKAIKNKRGKVQTVILDGVGHGVGTHGLIYCKLLGFLNKEWNMKMKY